MDQLVERLHGEVVTSVFRFASRMITLELGELEESIRNGRGICESRPRGKARRREAL
jgi:hypothetical protein